ncbi:Concanavalin A-like lectin/glucanases superfamily protein [Arenibacter nanhaiticus]|uniref:Concanavalin A-like lectin/glucanases superfamily protein n=1 Tax=Arenibacter nanhaiticus TaxID=558155 RepID=A0A1M6C8X8_9FLAO|nr:LamG domain-containing protein [Arenibacter nanhaiticus]SHI57459.1 Concanavalin A-like lectin/glucanases superfamily protein [Arenibacter nanhaiticus]
MKKITTILPLTFAYKLFAACSILLFLSCSQDEQGWQDTRYTENFEFYISHPNPITGEAYTEEELEGLSYDPKEKESYSEGQPINLAMVSLKKPLAVKVLLGKDLSLLETITEFTTVNQQYISADFETTLDKLGLIQIGDKAVLKFEILFEDGSMGASFFEIKHVKVKDTSIPVDFFVYLKKQVGEIIGLPTEDEVSSRVKDPKVGSILTFNGASDKVEITDNGSLNFRYTEDFSVGLWVNTTAANSDPSIIGDKDWGSGTNPGFIFAFTGNSGWKLNAGDGTNRIDVSGNAINDGEWHFLMATFDRDGNATIYEDGVVAGSTDMSAIGSMESGNLIHLSQDGTGSYGAWYQGSIGETYIYDYALSATEVAELSGVKTGVQLHTQNGNTSNITVTNQGGTTIGVDANKYTFSYNGTDGYSTITDNSKLDFRYANDFTVALWVKTTATNSDPSMIGDKNWAAGANKGFIFAYTGGAWKMNAGDGTNRIDINGNIINDGEWHLISVTFDRDGNAIAYQDGVEVGSVDMSSIGDMKSSFPINLAQDGTAAYGDWFEGELANIAIYDYVLTPEQMTSLYNE